MVPTFARPSESGAFRSFSPDTLTLPRLLAAHDVRYLLIGGFAVICHGYARLTGDVDFYYDRDAANVERLWRALLEFWDGSVPGIASASDLEDPTVINQFGRPPDRIDRIRSKRDAGRSKDPKPRRVHGPDCGVGPRPVGSSTRLPCTRRAEPAFTGRSRRVRELDHGQVPAAVEVPHDQAGVAWLEISAGVHPPRA